MIQAAAAVYMLILFVLWRNNNVLDIAIKLTNLGFALVLGFQALQTFGFIVQIP